MKVLVLQVSVGNTGGYADNNPEVQDMFMEHLVPTVRRYCDKHGYDYQMIREYPKDRDITYFNKNTKPIDFDYSKGGKNKCATLIRYLHMDQPDYDAVVSLDNDIYIPPHAKPLPAITGHMGAEDIGKSFADFKSKCALPQNKFINGGVQMVDRQTGKDLCRYIEMLVDKKTPPIHGLHSDQGYMNQYRSINHKNAYVLDSSWNHMVGLYPRNELDPFKDLNFVHYAGQATRKIFKNDYMRGLIV